MSDLNFKFYKVNNYFNEMFLLIYKKYMLRLIMEKDFIQITTVFMLE